MEIPMAVERTLSIVKPDATRRNLTGKINARFEEAGLRIVAQKRVWLSKQQAEQFYDVHRERDRKSTRLNSSHNSESRMPSSA
jgi:nucleoside diphosphate kinase